MQAFGLTALCLLIAFLIAQVTFSKALNAKLVEMFSGLHALNTGTVIVLSLSLAFVFGDVAQVHLRARAAILNEADSLRTLGRTSLSVDARVGDPLMTAIQQYAHDVIQKEWPDMARSAGANFSTSESSALAPLTRMSDIVLNPHNQQFMSQSTANQLVTLTNRVREARLLRAESSRYHIGYPRLGLVLLLLGAAIAVLTLSALSKRPMQIFANFILLWIATISLLVVCAQQNPFSALDFVSSLPLQEALQRLQVMTKSGV